jgi:hypothetical protein
MNRTRKGQSREVFRSAPIAQAGVPVATLTALAPKPDKAAMQPLKIARFWEDVFWRGLTWILPEELRFDALSSV